jgi:hypothetical protein
MLNPWHGTLAAAADFCHWLPRSLPHILTACRNEDLLPALTIAAEHLQNASSPVRSRFMFVKSRLCHRRTDRSSGCSNDPEPRRYGELWCSTTTLNRC